MTVCSATPAATANILTVKEDTTVLVHITPRHLLTTHGISSSTGPISTIHGGDSALCPRLRNSPTPSTSTSMVKTALSVNGYATETAVGDLMSQMNCPMNSSSISVKQ